MKKGQLTRIVRSLIIVGVLAVLWGTESDLAYNVAQQRAILLGRYTVEKMFLLIFLTPVLLAALFWTRKKNPQDPSARRLALFRWICLTAAVVFAVVFADIALRLLSRKHYVGDEQSFRRVSEKAYRGVAQDRPEFAFCYPKALPGYPDVPYVLTVDRSGFRNPQEQDQYDWIVLGDSFAEGSRVSDEHVWPALLASQRHVRIYNLGVSGGSPVTYLDTLRNFGVAKRPAKVLYMLYEGNDWRDSNFRKAKSDESPKKTLYDRTVRNSPVRRLLKESVLHFFGAVGCHRFADDPAVNRPSHPMYPVAWLPIEIPVGSGNVYAFDVKRFEDHYITEDRFRQTRGFSETARLLQETAALCRTVNAELTVIYAPDTPHVIMEDILDRVPPEQLHAFMSTLLKHPPEPAALSAALREGAGVRERVLKEFCEKNRIDFISLTEPLRQKTREGIHAYYTYDQHWSPEGHRVVADFLSGLIPAK